MNTCKLCNKELIKYQKTYCSSSCAAKYNNKVNPKRIKRPLAKCVRCSETVTHRYTKFCTKCREDGWSRVRYDKPRQSRTIQECIDSQTHKNSSNKYNSIRGHARILYNNLLNGPCEKCGYTKHVQLCHIKPIASFSPDTNIMEVNSRENIAILCPNCHWEFDHL